MSATGASVDPVVESPPTSAGAPADGADRPRPPLTSDRFRNITVVAIPTMLAVGLCLYQITARSLWLDEATSIAIAGQHGASFGAALARDGGNMLGYYALLHLLVGAFGSGTLLVRLPSVVAASGTVAVVCVLGIRLFDRRVALAAGLLSAVSLPLVFWGQDARGYAAMIALSAASFLALLSLLDAEHSGWRAWLGYVVLSTAAVYAGLEAVLVVPAQLVVLIWHRDRARAVLSAVAASAICCVPLAVLAAQRGASQLFWVPPPSLGTAKQVVQALTSSGLQPNFYTSTGGVLLGLAAVVLATGAWMTIRGLARREPAAWRPALLLSWLLVPIALALLVAIAGQSIFQARYLLVSLPAVGLLLGWTLMQRPVPRVLGACLLTVLLVLQALQLAPSYGASPENWRAATSYVLTRSRPGDCTAFYPQDSRTPFKYYLGRRSAPPSVLPQVPWSLVHPYVEDYASLAGPQLSLLPSACARVWLISSHEGQVGGPPASRSDYARYLRLEAGLRREYGHAQSANFGYRGAVVVSLFAR